MPEDIVARILRLPGYAVTTWAADDERERLTLWSGSLRARQSSSRRSTATPTPCCGGVGATGITSTCC